MISFKNYFFQRNIAFASFCMRFICNCQIVLHYNNNKTLIFESLSSAYSILHMNTKFLKKLSLYSLQHGLHYLNQFRNLLSKSDASLVTANVLANTFLGTGM